MQRKLVNALFSVEQAIQSLEGIGLRSGLERLKLKLFETKIPQSSSRM